jgi:TIR domain
MRIAWPDLLGYDIFISYAHTEASAYAAALEKQLEKADLKCFLDVEEAPAGTELESAITAALEKSRILVLVGTPSMPDRPWIRREIATFESRRANGNNYPHRRRSITARPYCNKLPP